MLNEKTLIDALNIAADSDSGMAFLEKQGIEHKLSYAELKKDALNTLGALGSSGVQQGDHLVLCVNDNPVFIRVFWACILGGIIPVPVGVGISEEHRNKLKRILGKLSSAWLLSTKADFERLGDSVSAQLPMDRVLSPSAIMNKQDAIGEIKNATPENVAFIQFSSGSTSDPKGVVLTHKNLMTNISGIIKCAGLAKADVSMSWMPLTHDMGLIGFHLSMLIAGADQYLIPTDLFSRRPLFWLQAASQKGATLLCSPNFGYKHYLRALGDKQPEELDLSRVRLIFNGAEPISVPLIEKFMSRMGAFGLPKNSMFPVYGLAEASLAVAFPKPGAPVEVVYVDRRSLGLSETVKSLPQDHEDAIGFVSEGQPITGCLVRLCDEQDQVLTQNTVGRIQISGDNVMAGYYRDEKNNAVSLTADGWVDTGDLGFMADQGLVVTGRNKDIIFAHGLNYYPHDLENLLVEQGVAELGKVVAAGFRPPASDEDELIIFLLYRKDAGGFVELAQQTKNITNKHAGLEVNHVIGVKRIPKTTSGKIQRRFLVADYAAGEFDGFIAELATHTTDTNEEQGHDDTAVSPIAAKIQGFVKELVPEKNLALDSNFFDAGISSLSLAEIHQRIEDEWPGVVDIVDLFDHQTISEVAAFIEQKSD